MHNQIFICLQKCTISKMHDEVESGVLEISSQAIEYQKFINDCYKGIFQLALKLFTICYEKFVCNKTIP